MTDADTTQTAHDAERLVYTYSDTILRVCYGYLGSREDAQDICHDVLLKILTNTTTFKSEEHERAYIIRTTINTCKNFLGRADVRLTDSYDTSPERLDTVTVDQENLELPEGDISLGEAIQTLPPTGREVILLHYWAGYSVKEIAAQLETSPGAISMRLNRARTLLRDTLTGVCHD